MALPESREQTFALKSQIPSAFLNAVQDAITAVYEGKNARPERFSPLHGRIHDRVAGASTQVNGLVKFNTGLQEVGAPLEDLMVGETLKTVRVRVQDDGSDPVLCSVKRFDASNNETTIVSGQSSGSGAWEWVSLTVDTSVAAGDRFMLTVKNGEPTGIPTGDMFAASVGVTSELVA